MNLCTSCESNLAVPCKLCGWTEVCAHCLGEHLHDKHSDDFIKELEALLLRFSATLCGNGNTIEVFFGDRGDDRFAVPDGSQLPIY